jgi:dolichol-phosphate mannosyltransferase
MRDAWADNGTAGGVPRAESDIVSVIVPTLNEVDNIDLILTAIFKEARFDLAFEVLVADGGSRDGTVDRVHEWEKKANVRLVTGDGRSGLSGDVLNAARCARGSIIIVMDADLSHPASSIPDLVAPIRAGTSDMVVASRYVPGGSVPDWPFKRRFLSRLGCMFAWPFTDVKDSMSGYFAVRREFLVDVDPNAAGFKIGLEVMAASGDDIRVSEVPIAFRDRELGTSKIGAKQLLQYGRRLMVLAGGAVSMSTVGRFATVGALGVGVDYGIFEILSAFGFGLLAAHIASFLCAAAFNYALNSRWSFAEARRTATEPEWQTFARFFSVSLMALFLRGGVIALAAGVWGWPKELALILGIAAGTVVNYLGGAFFVFPPAGTRISPSVRWRIASVAVALYAVILRLIYMRSLNLIPEESYYWNYAQHLDYGYLDHPPMVAWTVWLMTSVFGMNEFGVRIGAMLFWFVSAAFIFKFAQNLYGKTAAFVSLLLFATLPFFFASGFLMMPDAPLTAAWAGALYFAERALFAERNKAWLGLGLCLGIGLLSKYSIVLLGPPLLMFVAIDPQSRTWFFKPWPYMGAALALLFFSPVIAWNAAHDWASFAFQSTRRVDAPAHFALPTFSVYVLALLTPIGCVAAYSVFARRPSATADTSAMGVYRRWLFTALLTLFPFSVFAIFSMFHPGKLNWTGPIWLSVLPAIAHMIGDKTARPVFPKLNLQHGWAITIAVVMVLAGGGFHYMTIGLPGVSYRGGTHLRDIPVAWREFGDQAERIVSEVQGATGQRPLIVGMDKYFISSELAFYSPDHKGFERSAGRSLVGIESESLMYGYWFPAQNQIGKTIVLFSFDAAPLEYPSVLEHFRRLDPVKTETVVRGKDTLGQFYYRVGFDYRAGGSPAAGE